MVSVAAIARSVPQPTPATTVGRSAPAVASDPENRPDGYLVRRRAVDRGVPLITDPSLARHVVTALVTHGEDSLRARAWNDFLEP